MTSTTRALVALMLAAASGCDSAGRPRAVRVEAVTADASADAALDWTNGGEDLPEYSLGRLLISHVSAAELTLFDLDTSQLAARIPFEANALIEAGGSGRYGYAHSSAQGALRVFDPGQWLLSHIDHFHIIRGEQRLMAEQVQMPSLSSLIAHDGWLTAYDSSSGLAAFFQERSITAGSFAPASMALPATITGGVAAISRAQLIASEASELSQRSVLDPQQLLARFSGCSEPRGIAARGERVFVGCAEGLLELSWNASTELFEPVLSSVEGGRVLNVRTTERYDGAVLQIGERTIGLLGPRGPALRRIALSSDIVFLELRRQGNAALVLTQDGRAHELDLEMGALKRSTELLAALGHEKALVHVALSHAYAYVTDPRASHVAVMRLRTMQRERDIPLHAPAYDVAVVGVPSNYTDERE
jgi:hypothetical protein